MLTEKLKTKTKRFIREVARQPVPDRPCIAIAILIYVQPLQEKLISGTLDTIMQTPSICEALEGTSRAVKPRAESTKTQCWRKAGENQQETSQQLLIKQQRKCKEHKYKTYTNFTTIKSSSPSQTSSKHSTAYDMTTWTCWHKIVCR